MSDHGFLFVTFNGEASPMGEQVYFGLSRNGREWSALNGAEPVLISKVGERGVRDPFIIRAHDGPKFFLIATDLSVHFKPNWGQAVRAGSHSVVIWDSEDLVHWSEPRLVRVAAGDAGCTWAPEAIFDEETGDYLMFWASTSGRDDFARQRIWASRTSDFKTFGEPFIYIDRPDHVIDTTMIRTDGRYYRFSKDERLLSITMEVSNSVMGPWQDIPDFSLASMTGYEGPFCFELEPSKWCLLLDHFTQGAGYKPFVADDLPSGQFTAATGFQFPFRFRHGSVLRVTAEEFDRLQDAFNSEGGGTS